MNRDTPDPLRGFWSTPINTQAVGSFGPELLRVLSGMATPRRAPADCPHPIDSPEGRDWIKRNCAWSNTDDITAADRRIADAGLGPARSTLNTTMPDPADPAYLDMLAEQIATRDEIQQSVELSRIKAEIVAGSSVFTPARLIQWNASPS